MGEVVTELEVVEAVVEAEVAVVTAAEDVWHVRVSKEFQKFVRE